MIETIGQVPIGEIAVSSDPNDQFVIYGLGSCVAVCVYDRTKRVGGVLHALLPSNPRSDRGGGKPSKFVDQGVPLLIDAVTALGGRPRRMSACLVGGANTIKTPYLNFNSSLNIGQRNVQAAEAALQAAGLKVSAQATGGTAGRTMKFYLTDGQITVKMLGQTIQILA